MSLRFLLLLVSRWAVGLAVIVALSGCMHRTPSPQDEAMYPLFGISDDAPAEPRLAHVVLRPRENVVNFINAPLWEGGQWVQLARVEVFRRDTEADSLRRNGTIEFAPGDDVRSVEATYADTSRSALTNRYEFRAYTAGGALVPLPVLYSTTDSTYARTMRGGS